MLDQEDSTLQLVCQTHPEIKNTITTNLVDWDDTRAKITAMGPFHHLVNNAGDKIISINLLKRLVHYTYLRRRWETGRNITEHQTYVY